MLRWRVQLLFLSRCVQRDVASFCLEQAGLPSRLHLGRSLFLLSSPGMSNLETAENERSVEPLSLCPPTTSSMASRHDLADALSSLDLSEDNSSTYGPEDPSCLPSPSLVDAVAPPSLLPLHVELPFEVIDAIIDESDQEDLARWCLISSSCLRVAGPLLWREVVFSSNQQLSRVLKIHDEVRPQAEVLRRHKADGLALTADRRARPSLVSPHETATASRSCLAVFI